MILRKGSIGADVGDLQRRLFTIGYKVDQTNIYDEKTFNVVRQLQARSKLVVDGIYGPKTDAVLRGSETGYLLKQSDIDAAAAALGVDVASVMAVNEVESAGLGFIKPDYPVILFERHVFWRQLVKHGVDPRPLSKKYPGIISQQRGGYAGGQSEYTRLGVARSLHEIAAYEACSWGAFQIMGYHWEHLGYESTDQFLDAMRSNEAGQLDAFVRFILADSSLHRALKAKKWSTFAKIYNGPEYAKNLYDVKLSRAYSKYTEMFTEAA